ncbi:hypothetical protein, partial [Longimicrobium sp.]|uniref:hypothetical protein n=1 Tax=Longimicrobium sp. TaxID=2029185 RepID=UPI002E309B0F
QGAFATASEKFLEELNTTREAGRIRRKEMKTIDEGGDDIALSRIHTQHEEMTLAATLEPTPERPRRRGRRKAGAI